jgi:hypothetical protein
MDIRQRLLGDLKKVQMGLKEFVSEATSLKNKGVGPNALREFQRKSQKSTSNLHQQAGMLGSYLFILDGLEKQGEQIPLQLRKEVAEYLNRIDMGFMNFDPDKLSPRVACDVHIGYNKTRKIYLDSGYPESDLPDKYPAEQFCIKRKGINKKIRQRINKLVGN